MISMNKLLQFIYVFLYLCLLILIIPMSMLLIILETFLEIVIALYDENAQNFKE